MVSSKLLETRSSQQLIVTVCQLRTEDRRFALDAEPDRFQVGCLLAEHRIGPQGTRHLDVLLDSARRPYLCDK